MNLKIQPAAVNFNPEDARRIFEVYESQFLTSMEEFCQKKVRLRVPMIPIPVLLSFIKHATEIFRDEPMILNLDGPITIVGDLNGHLPDLLRVLQKTGSPNIRKYLFLGNTVNRGQFSIEVISLILIMKILYPQQVFLIRGQCEFREFCESEGFLREIETLYENKTLYLPFIQMFNILPVAAIVNKKILCLNGGFGPSIDDLSTISQLKRPLVTFNSQVLVELFWSDPTEALPMYLPSSRGYGNLYGEQALNDFLKAIKMKKLIRGHQCVAQGCQPLFDNQLITVFTASKFENSNNNKSGFVNIQSSEPNAPIDIRTLPPLDYLMKTDVNFTVSESENAFIVTQLPMFMQNASKSRLPSLSNTRLPTQNGFRLSSSRIGTAAEAPQPQNRMLRKPPPRRFSSVQKSVSRLIVNL